MSIGSNDLTQLTLGLDRDSGLEQLAGDFDERDPAVEACRSRGAIRACRAVGKYIGICGQGPSDHPTLPTGWPRRASCHLAQPGHGDRHLAATLGAGPLKAKVRRPGPRVVALTGAG